MNAIRNDSFKDDVIYGPKPISFKGWALGIFLFIFGFFLLRSGLNSFAHTGDDPFQRVRALKYILVGSLSIGLFGLGLIGMFINIIQKRPRLTLSLKNVVLDNSLKRSCSADWDSLGLFEITSLGIKGKLRFIRSKITGPHIIGNIKTGGDFLINTSLLDVDINSLLEELNCRRGRAIGEEYSPQVKDEMPVEPKKLNGLNSSRYWGLWFAGVGFGTLFLGRVTERILDIPRLPYEQYMAAGALLIGAIFATYMSWKK